MELIITTDSAGEKRRAFDFNPAHYKRDDDLEADYIGGGIIVGLRKVDRKQQNENVQSQEE